MKVRAIIALWCLLTHLFNVEPYRYESGPPIRFVYAEPPLYVYYPKILSQPVTKTELAEAAVVIWTPPEFSLPTDYDVLSREKLAKPHHDYPAADLGMPVGTNVFAVRRGVVVRAAVSNGRCGGQVTIDTDAGQMMYCHLSAVYVKVGDWVETATLIGLSGGKPGMRGAGSSTAPHLHLAIKRNGRDVCPQPLLLSIWDQQEPDFSNTTRCHY